MQTPHSNKIELPEEEVLRLNDWAAPAAWVLAIGAGLVGIFLIIVSPPPDDHSDASLRLLLGLAWLAFALVPATGARAGVVLRNDGEGIVVRSRFRASCYRWDQIEDFRLAPSLYRAALRIHLRDGGEIRAIGFGAKSRDEERRAEAMVVELNRRVAGASLNHASGNS